MTEPCSFKNFIINNYSTKIDKFVENYFTNNRDIIKSKKLIRITNIDYDASEIIKIGVKDLPGDAISFDMIIKSCFWAYGKSEYYDEDEDEIYQWFTIKGAGKLSNKLKTLKLMEISTYSESEQIHNYKKLSDELIPLISKIQLDDIAKDFLKKYFPNSLNIPTKIDPFILAKKMNLKIEQHKLSKDSSIFGSIIFDDCTLEVWDNNKEENKKFTKGTIVVDPNVYYLRNLGSFNNTIIHECIHWEFHKKAFEFEKIYNKDINKITCFVNGKMGTTKKRKNESYIEWQANEITPRVQAPREMLIKKFREYSNKYDSISSSSLILDSIENIIDDLSRFFSISRQSAKIRLIECGYNIARGAFNYIDNKYIKPFAYNEKALLDNQTFSIGLEDLIIETIKNPNLNKLIEQGKLIYTNSFLCLNDSKYIEKSTKELTEYARLNVNECCLKFNIIVERNNKILKKECILCRDINTGIKYKIEFDKTVNNNMFLQSQAIIESEKFINEGLDCICNCLSKSLKSLMKWVNISEKKLSDKSEVSEKTIQRIRTGQSTSPSLETMVALCIGLELPYKISLLFIEKAGLKLICNTEEKMLYNFFLKDGCNFDIYECDELLKTKRFKGFIKE